MVSMEHEILVELFKNRPSMAAELLSESLHVAMPAYEEARVVSAEFTEIQPAQYRADLVVVLFHHEKPVRVNIVEVQLSSDPEKRFSWPVYVAVSREEHHCPVDLLVVAPDPTVARWCEQPIPMGVPDFVLRPPVLRKEVIPIITNSNEAIRRPELALLSAMAYGDSDRAPEIAEAAVDGFSALDDKRASFYTDILYNAINEAARHALEAKMKGYVYTSPFAVKYIQEGIELGRSEGIKLGRDEGVKLGRDEGSKSAASRSLLTVIRARGFDIPESIRQRIHAEQDLSRLEQWLERATVATNLSEVFVEPS